jgi:hypothetical protein
MARPRLALGTYGKINVNKVGPDKFLARCQYRDFDGKIYEVERYGPTAGKAETRLKEAIRDWVAPIAGAEITRNSKFAEVAALWLNLDPPVKMGCEAVS